MTRFLNGLDKGLSAVEAVIIATLSLAALVLGCVQVVLRYGFNTGFTWSESTFVLLTVAAMLFGGSLAVKQDKHVRVELMAMIAPRRVGFALEIISDVAALALCAFFTYCGVLYASFSYEMGAILPDLGVPEWPIYVLVPVTMGAFTLRYAIRLLRALRGEAPASAGPAQEIAASWERRS